MSTYLKSYDSADDIRMMFLTLESKELKKELFKNLPLGSPIKNGEPTRISSPFGPRTDFLTRKAKLHRGVDIAANVATPIEATADGKIVDESISYNGYGFQLLIEHGHGFRTRYAHMYFLRKRKGDIVRKGEVIGFVGSTGKSTGNHLHYEIIKNGEHRNPLPYMEFFNKEM